MVKPTFCVVDVGTGGVKCLVFDGKGSLVFKESSAIDFQFNGPAISFDPVKVWKDVCRMSRKAERQCSKRRLEIVTISSTSMREGNVFYDRNAKELLAVPNLDARAYKEAEEIQDPLGDEIYLESGHWPSAIFLINRLKHIQKINPETFSKIAKVSMINDWILFKFSGRIASEPTNGCETGLFNLKKRNWSDQLIQECQYDRSLFPDMQECGSVLGDITKEASLASGLKRSTQVIVGAADTEAAVAGCGLFEPGNVAAVAGTTTPVQAVVEDPLLDAEKRTWTCCHVRPNRWTIESNAGATGLVVSWWARMSGQEFAGLDREVQRDKPPAGRVRVTMGTSLMNAKRPHPVSGSISRISSWSRRSEVTLGILEANCFSVRANLEQLESIAGKRFGELYFCGGASASKLWRDLQAGILGRYLISFIEGEATGRGAAMLSAVAFGSFSGLQNASAAFLRGKSTIKPDACTFETYDPIYQEWLSSMNK
jgi:autoinducer-2 kinase